MKIFTSKKIREADSYTIIHEPITSTNLMERAAGKCADWITQRFDSSYSFKIFCGVGNNGGDGLVIARKLFEKGYKTEVLIVRFSEKCSDDFLINYERAKIISGLAVYDSGEREAFLLSENIPQEQIFIDAIFGTGLTRPAEGLGADIIKEINRLNNTVISIDIPSGLFCEENNHIPSEKIIKATHTLTFEFPKLSFLLPDSGVFAGNWEVISIGLDKKFLRDTPSEYFFSEKKIIENIIKSRGKFSHKGNFGHALLLSGSIGKIGASVLASKACLRSGAGLLTTHVPKKGVTTLQISVPEAMVSIDESDDFISTLPEIEKFNAVGIGPGIGKEKSTVALVKSLIQNSAVPLVIDADAINIISENKTWIPFIPKKSIFTPHQKEFERLTGKSKSSYERMMKQIDFAKKFSCFVILKGAFTSIACPDGRIFFNSTGNPGMATAGSGDVLTGILTGLLARGYSQFEASVLGVYLHGLAGDIAAEKKDVESLIAGDIIENISNAYSHFRRKP